MDNSLYTLERDVIYPVTDGPSAGDFGPAVVRTVPLSFEVELPSKVKTWLTLDLTGIKKRSTTPVGLFVVGIEARIFGDHSQECILEYDFHTHTGEFCLL